MEKDIIREHDSDNRVARALQDNRLSFNSESISLTEIFFTELLFHTARFHKIGKYDNSIDDFAYSSIHYIVVCDESGKS